MSLLGSMVAGGVAGGSKSYIEVQDERKKALREKQKEEMLMRRMEHLQELSHNFQKEMAADAREYQDEVRHGEKLDKKEEEARKNLDSRLAAKALEAQASGDKSGILGETGGDAYSVPLTEDDMSGQGLLALKGEQYKRDQDRQDRDMKEKEYDLKVTEADARLKALDAKLETKNTLSVKDEETIREITRDKVYGELGFKYDDTLKQYVTNDDKPLTPQQKNKAEQLVDKVSAQIVGLKREGVSVSEAFALMGQQDDTQDFGGKQPYTGNKPPEPGARRGTDGFWYVDRGKGWEIVLEGEDAPEPDPDPEDTEGLLATTDQPEKEADALAPRQAAMTRQEEMEEAMKDRRSPVQKFGEQLMEGDTGATSRRKTRDRATFGGNRRPF